MELNVVKHTHTHDSFNLLILQVRNPVSIIHTRSIIETVFRDVKPLITRKH